MRFGTDCDPTPATAVAPTSLGWVHGDPDPGPPRPRPVPRPEPTPAPGAKRIRNGSPQQEAFWAELRDGTTHVLLEARAGTGKSSSCREGMHRLLRDKPGLVIRYCCYNKAIAAEFDRSCPTGVECGTMHKFGLLALQAAFRSQIDENKTYTLLDQEPGGSDLKRYVRKSVATLVGHAKNQGCRPDSADLVRTLFDLVTAYDVETWGRSDQVVTLAARILRRSAETTAIIDFDDMLWLSVVYGVPFPGVDFLFIDECQDLNPVQHELAELMSGSGRTVVVGDPFQAIYGWRGAATDSIPRLRDRLNAVTLPLTVTWRCPKSHVRLAQELVPDFEAAPEAAEGVLNRDDAGAVDDARPGDLVLCRANAPLLSACLKQIGMRRPAVMRGRDIGKDLLSVLRKVELAAGEPQTIPQLVRGIALWRAREIGRLEAKDGSERKIEGIEDQAACLEAVAEGCSGPAEVPKVIGQLFTDGDTSDRVTFSTVHRAKGSEAPGVVYLQIPYSERRDKLRPPRPWEVQQRKNLRYVALTRSLSSLSLVS